MNKKTAETVIPIERWGKDHWSTYAFAETVAVDHKGFIDNDLARHMRNDGKKYPTLLKGWSRENNEGNEAPCHDDWDCLADAEYYGLLTINRHSEREPQIRIGHKVVFTELGQEVAGQLRAHKANGGNYSGFEPKGI